jgi:tetratricopeptide (TPR) repeat protein
VVSSRRVSQTAWMAIGSLTVIFGGCGSHDGADWHVGRALGFERMGRTDEAISEYREAVRLRPDIPGYQSALGVVLAKTGHYEEALPYLKQAIRLYPKNATAQYWLGVSLVQLGRSEEGIAALQQAVGVNPRDARAYLALGKVMSGVGRHAEAVAAFERAKEMDGEALKADREAERAYAASSGAH